MLGSAMEAEDIVQEAYLRYQEVDQAAVQSPKSYLCSIVTRLAINHLNSARVQREEYVGPWLPEPVLTANTLTTDAQPADLESLSMAFLVLLESLSPTERATFLLREVFDYEYIEIAPIVGKSEETCRQLYSRAKHHITENRPRFKSTAETHQRLMTRFLEAIERGDLDALTQLLADDVVVYTDGGGKSFAAKLPVTGRERAALFLMHAPRFGPAEITYDFVSMNGQNAVIIRAMDRTPVAALTFEADEESIHRFYVVNNPDKLRHI
jgi:RNA polymerase sigma-70 factor (ECF subfamily)